MVTIKAGRPTRNETFTGADLAGATGTTNRTLSISAKASSEIIFVQGAYLHPTVDYTKTTVLGVSQYTFINKVYDSFYIQIYYWI